MKRFTIPFIIGAVWYMFGGEAAAWVGGSITGLILFFLWEIWRDNWYWDRQKLRDARKGVDNGRR